MMQGVLGRLAKLEAVRQAREQGPTKPVMPRILLTEKDWAEVPEGALIHMGGSTPRVYRYLGGYNPETSSFLGEEVDLGYWESWGLQSIDYVVLEI